MSNKLITKESIEEISRDKLPPLVSEVIDFTLLSKSYRNPMTTIPKYQSSFFNVQSTIRAMHLTPYRRGALSKELTYSVFKNIIEKIAELTPTLMRHSLDGDGNQVTPPYEVSQNKKIVSDYYIFPMVNGTSINDFTFKTFTNSDDCEHWQVGRKFSIIEPSDYRTNKITENDYVDLEPLINTEWSKVIAKRPVGRPPKPVDPFGGKQKGNYKKRVTMKKLDKKLNRIMKMIEELKK